MTAISTTVHAASLLALVSVLAQGKLLLELAAQLAVHGHELLARADEGLARGDASVCLDTDEEFRHVRVGNYN